MTSPAKTLAGHRWHPLAVHFPIACWIIALIVELVFYISPQWIMPGGLAPGPLAALLLWIGNATALAAMGLGVLDMAKLPDAANVINTVYKHMAWMTSAWLLMLLAGGLRLADNGWMAPAHEGIIALELMAVGCLIAGGVQASHLVYDLHLGDKR